MSTVNQSIETPRHRYEGLEDFSLPSEDLTNNFEESNAHLAELFNELEDEVDIVQETTLTSEQTQHQPDNEDLLNHRENNELMSAKIEQLMEDVKAMNKKLESQTNKLEAQSKKLDVVEAELLEEKAKVKRLEAIVDKLQKEKREEMDEDKADEKADEDDADEAEADEDEADEQEAEEDEADEEEANEQEADEAEAEIEEEFQQLPTADEAHESIDEEAEDGGGDALATMPTIAKGVEWVLKADKNQKEWEKLLREHQGTLPEILHTRNGTRWTYFTTLATERQLIEKCKEWGVNLLHNRKKERTVYCIGRRRRDKLLRMDEGEKFHIYRGPHKHCCGREDGTTWAD